MLSSGPFKIVHLSDLHLTASDGDRRSEPKMFGKLRGMNAAFRRIVMAPDVQSADVVLVTGDVTDSGSIECWREFWTTSEVAGISERLLVVPGNHDLCCLSLRLFGSKRVWREADIAKVKAGLRLCGQETKLPWAWQANEQVVIFGLNSNNFGNASIIENAMGNVGYYHLKAFADLLYKYREVPVKIVALHHSPNIPLKKTALKRKQKPMSRRSRKLHEIPQDQRHALLLLCQSHKVRLVVHGHLHEAEDRKVSGVRIVGAPATTEPDGKSGKYPFFVYTVEPRGDGWVCRVRRRWE